MCMCLCMCMFFFFARFHRRLHWTSTKVCHHRQQSWFHNILSSETRSSLVVLRAIIFFLENVLMSIYLYIHFSVVAGTSSSTLTTSGASTRIKLPRKGAFSKQTMIKKSSFKACFFEWNTNRGMVSTKEERFLRRFARRWIALVQNRATELQNCGRFHGKIKRYQMCYLERMFYFLKKEIWKCFSVLFQF